MTFKQPGRSGLRASDRYLRTLIFGEAGEPGTPAAEATRMTVMIAEDAARPTDVAL